MMSHDKRAFTLVELLMVIVVISVLAALLLPTLERSLEQSRRIVCMNNGHQQYLAAMAYASNYNGFFPGPTRIAIGSGSIEGDDYFASRTGTNTGLLYYDALYVLVFNEQMLSGPALDCPSMDFRVALIPEGGTQNVTHYSYRYNGGSYVVNNYRNKNSFYGTANRYQPLFCDSPAYRRNGANPYETFEQTTLRYMYARWAHRDGGNIVDHAGCGRFVPSYFNVSGPYSWPGTGSFYYGITHWRLIAYFDQQ